MTAQAQLIPAEPYTHDVRTLRALGGVYVWYWENLDTGANSGQAFATEQEAIASAWGDHKAPLGS